MNQKPLSEMTIRERRDAVNIRMGIPIRMHPKQKRAWIIGLTILVIVVLSFMPDGGVTP